MKKFYQLLVLLLVFSLVFTGCSSNEETKKDNDQKTESEKIVIGGLAPLTGPVATYGVSTSNGIKLAVEEINKNGGILGKQLEYRLEDEKGDKIEAVNAYHKLVDSGIDVLLGDVTSSTSEAVASEAVKDNIPMITPTGTQLGITKGRHNVFRACFVDPYQGQILANFVKELPAKKVAVLTNTSSDYSDGVSNGFIEEANKLGLEIVAHENYGENDNDFRAQLTKIKDKNPEVLLIPDYYEKNALLVPQAREVGITATIVGADGWDGTIKQLAKEEQSVLNGVYFANHYAINDTNPKVSEFVNGYREKFGEDPTSFSALGYDATYLLKSAIEKAQSLDSEKLIAALETIEFEGVTGKLKYDQDHNPIKSVTMIEIKDGQYTLKSIVEPK